jgi:hypothetical protein
MLAASVYYHGTKAVLQPGQIVEPRVEHYVDPNGYGEEKMGYAFATTDYATAQRYARKPHAGLGQNYGNDGYVYEIEPLQEDVVPDPLGNSFGNTEDYVSPSGWRVIRLLETIPGEVE